MFGAKRGSRMRARLAAPLVVLCLGIGALTAGSADAQINYVDGTYASVGGGCDNSLGELHFSDITSIPAGSYYMVWIYVWNQQKWTNTGWYASDIGFNGAFNYHGWLYMYAEIARPDGAGGWTYAGEPFTTTVQDGQYRAGSWCYQL